MKLNFFNSVDGVRLGYADQGRGTPVILLAGYSGPATSWLLQEKALLKNGCRIIAFDRRSHGASDNPPHGQDMATQGKDLDALFRHLNIDRAFLVGQSMGASCVWSYISQFGTARVLGAISIDQTPKMIGDETWPHGMVGLTRETRPTFFDNPLPRPNKQPVNGVLIRILLRGPKYLRFDSAGTKPLLLDHADADWRETIRKTEVPVLFVAGEESPFWPKEHAAASAALCPKGDSAIVAGAGHAVNWECPEEFNAVMLAFLAKVGKAR